MGNSRWRVTGLSGQGLLSAQRLARALIWGVQAELDLTPKPGLVDRCDSGSHEDLNYLLMARSIELLEAHFQKCVVGLEQEQPLAWFRELGIATEKRMIQSFGTNTHRGAVFLGTLLLIGVHDAGSDSRAVSLAVATNSRRLFSTAMPLNTIGSKTRLHYRVGGIVEEAMNGLPALFRVGVPSLQEAESLKWSQSHGQFLALARLMQSVTDTTALRRCGPTGLLQLVRDGSQLETLLRQGGDPLKLLSELNSQYREARLTMGGVADLLAMTIAWGYFAAGEENIG